MENQKTASKQHILFGVFYGLVMILVFTMMYVMNVDPLENPTLSKLSSCLSYIIFPCLFIYLGITDFKKNNSNFISLGECLKTGVTVSVVGATLFVLFYVIFNLIFPEYINEVLSQTRQIMLKQNPNATREQMELGVAMSKKFASPLVFIPFTLVIFSFLGLIYSLIIGLIVKKDRPQFI